VDIKPKTSPIYQTSVFTFDDLNELEAYFEQPGQGYMYTRFGNPNSDELATEVNLLERGQGGVVTSSGMSAILTGILTYCQAGDHVLCAEEIYGGSSTLLAKELGRLGVGVTFVPTADTYNLEEYAVSGTKLMLAETMSNPLLQVLDIRRLAEECQQYHVHLLIDNTFASPVITRPLELGADMVMHSVTKYLSGHSDVTAGVLVAARKEDHTRARQIMVNYGLNLSPFESWLASKGLKTLRLRMKQHSANALELAKFLKQHPKVKHVYYPGLPEHPQHALAQQQGGGLFGGMLSFRIQDEVTAVNRLMQSLHYIVFAPSLAGVATTVSHPLKTSHRALSPEKQERLGITMGLIRLSVGIEEPEDIIQDMQQALDQL
jgi:cystathionine beta-lyase/cystathionine gamma-synthase